MKAFRRRSVWIYVFPIIRMYECMIRQRVSEVNCQYSIIIKCPERQEDGVANTIKTRDSKSGHTMRRPCRQGWQLSCERLPAVVALTCPNTRGLRIFSAILMRFALFHAGVMEVKMQGWVPNSWSSSMSYHPKTVKSLSSVSLLHN
jgi:hypothetical protein